MLHLRFSHTFLNWYCYKYISFGTHSSSWNLAAVCQLQRNWKEWKWYPAVYCMRCLHVFHYINLLLFLPPPFLSACLSFFLSSLRNINSLSEMCYFVKGHSIQYLENRILPCTYWQHVLLRLSAHVFFYLILIIIILHSTFFRIACIFEIFISYTSLIHMSLISYVVFHSTNSAMLVM
jgi:hypothetical protein